MVIMIMTFMSKCIMACSFGFMQQYGQASLKDDGSIINWTIVHDLVVDGQWARQRAK